MLVGVGHPRQGELAEVAQADGPLAPFPRQAQGGKEERQQDRNDRDYDEQFNEREAAGGSSWVRTTAPPTRIRLRAADLSGSATHR